MKVLVILIFCLIESHGFKYQYNSTFRDYQYTVPEIKMEDFEEYLFNQSTLDTYVGFIVDERWCRHGSRFVCYFNEVNHQFLTGPSYCQQKNWDNGTIDNLRYINADNLQHRVALIDVDADFMDKHNIPGVPHLRLYKNTGEQIEMMNKVYDEYPTVVMQIRNFIAEQTYDESIDHPCLKYYLVCCNGKLTQNVTSEQAGTIYPYSMHGTLFPDKFSMFCIDVPSLPRRITNHATKEDEMDEYPWKNFLTLYSGMYNETMSKHHRNTHYI